MPQIQIIFYSYSRIKNCNIKITIYFSPSIICSKNRDLYQSNSEIHNINTRFISDLPTSAANLTTFQKGPFCFGIKVFNHLPTDITNASHYINQFRSVLKYFILINSFYTLQEYFTWNSNTDLGSV